jgi:hypothetical protein
VLESLVRTIFPTVPVGAVNGVVGRFAAWVLPVTLQRSTVAIAPATVTPTPPSP